MVKFWYITRWEGKRLKGCVFSPPSLAPVPGARKRNLSIGSIPVCLIDFEIQLLFLWKETSIRHALSWSASGFPLRSRVHCRSSCPTLYDARMVAEPASAPPPAGHPYCCRRWIASSIVRFFGTQSHGTVLLSTSLAWPAVCSQAETETFSQLSAIPFALPCILGLGWLKVSCNIS